MYNILIIEDEVKAVKSLIKAISTYDPSITILAQLDSVESTLNYFNTKTNTLPDLIFSDIKLIDGQSFEIFESIKLNCPVVFCTAYDEYAIKAFDANAIGYILKPFSQSEIDNVLNKYKSVKESELEKLKLIFGQLNLLKQQESKTLLINYKEKFIPVKTSDIPYFYFTEGKTYAWQFDKLNRLSQRLEDLENILDSTDFYRANRQFIVNRKFIKDFENYFSRKLILNLKVSTEEKIIISKEKATSFVKWLEG